jgi:hypothetical protein
LNRAFSLLESVAIGVPQTIYYHYHLNHHWGTTTPRGRMERPRTGGLPIATARETTPSRSGATV